MKPYEKQKTPEQLFKELTATVETLTAKIKVLEDKPLPDGRRPQKIPDQALLLRELNIPETRVPLEGRVYCFPAGKKGNKLRMLETGRGAKTQFPELVRVELVLDPRKVVNDGRALIHKNMSFCFVRNFFDPETGGTGWSPNQNEVHIEKWKEWRDQGIRFYDPDETEGETE